MWSARSSDFLNIPPPVPSVPTKSVSHQLQMAFSPSFRTPASPSSPCQVRPAKSLTNAHDSAIGCDAGNSCGSADCNRYNPADFYGPFRLPICPGRVNKKARHCRAFGRWAYSGLRSPLRRVSTIVPRRLGWWLALLEDRSGHCS